VSIRTWLSYGPAVGPAKQELAPGEAASTAVGPASFRYHSVAFAGGRFVAVGSARTVVEPPPRITASYATSTDGVTWKGGEFPEEYALALDPLRPDAPRTPKVFALHDGRFMVWTEKGVIYSRDGLNWTPAAPAPATPFDHLDAWCSCVGPGQILLGMNHRSSGTTLNTQRQCVLRSTDGEQWQVTRTADGQAADEGLARVRYGGVFSSIVYTGSNYVAVCPFNAGGPLGLGATTSNKTVQTSTDGMTWTQRTMPDAAFSVSGVAHSKETTVAAGVVGRGSARRVATSTNRGASWTMRNLPTASEFGTERVRIAAGGGSFLFVDYDESYLSADGITWKAAGLPLARTAGDRSIAFGNGVFVVVDQTNTIHTLKPA
jgi:hypothetical protein